MFLHQQNTKCVTGADVVRLVFHSRAPKKSRFIECFPFQADRHLAINTRIGRRISAAVRACAIASSVLPSAKSEVAKARCAPSLFVVTASVCGHRESALRQNVV